MPPVKWTFPASAKTGPRLVPRRFGAPRILSIQEAEALTKARRAQRALQEGVSDPAIQPHDDSAIEEASSVSRLEQHLHQQVAEAAPADGCSPATHAPSSFDAQSSNAIHAVREERAAAERMGEQQEARTLSLRISPEQCIESVVRRRFDDVGRAFMTDQQRAEQLLNAHSPDLASAAHANQQPAGKFAQTRQ